MKSEKILAIVKKIKKDVLLNYPKTQPMKIDEERIGPSIKYSANHALYMANELENKLENESGEAPSSVERHFGFLQAMAFHLDLYSVEDLKKLNMPQGSEYKKDYGINER